MVQYNTAIRLSTPKTLSDGTDAVTELTNRIKNNLDKLNYLDLQPNSPCLTNTSMFSDNGTDYVKTSGRYENKETDVLNVIQDNIIKTDFDWYLVEYHECDHHPDQQTTGCGDWKVLEEDGSIPSGVKS